MFVYIRSAAFVIVVTQKLVLQQFKNVTAKCTETLSPPLSIQCLLARRLNGTVHGTVRLNGTVHGTVRLNGTVHMKNHQLQGKLM